MVALERALQAADADGSQSAAGLFVYDNAKVRTYLPVIVPKESCSHSSRLSAFAADLAFVLTYGAQIPLRPSEPLLLYTEILR